MIVFVASLIKCSVILEQSTIYYLISVHPVSTFSTSISKVIPKIVVMLKPMIMIRLELMIVMLILMIVTVISKSMIMIRLIARSRLELIIVTMLPLNLSLYANRLTKT